MTPAQDALLAAARDLVALIRTGEPPGDQGLTEAIDRVLCAFHRTGDSPAEISDADWPKADYRTNYGEFGARFPALGHYRVADPLDLSSASLMTGDAIDDLTDIAQDLEAALWYAEHHGADAALGHLRQFYFHWAGHARELLSYLYARQFH